MLLLIAVGPSIRCVGKALSKVSKRCRKRKHIPDRRVHVNYDECFALGCTNERKRKKSKTKSRVCKGGIRSRSGA